MAGQHDENWHGWGMQGVTLSVGPHPEKAGQYALVMSVNDEPAPMAVFVGQDEALEVMDFLDAAFRQSAQALQRMAAMMEGT